MFNVDTVFAQKYKNRNDCRDDNSSNWCKNYFQHYDNGNTASQRIGQSQSSSQNSQVVSGGDTVGSGNNVNVQGQRNTGINALGQQ